MLAEQRRQALTERLAGLFVERERLRGKDIYTFLEHEEARITKFLLDDTATMEDYVGLIGTDEFARPVESLHLPSRAATCLHDAHITTIGQLLQHSSYDLAPIEGLGKDTLKKIEEAITANGPLQRRWAQVNEDGSGPGLTGSVP